MAPSEAPTDITLKIKVPPGYIEGGLDEYSLGSVATSATIGQVRQQIQNTIPGHPSPERQRLLYGGRALVDDAQTLADALNTRRDATQDTYVVHLIIKGETPASGAASQAPPLPVRPITNAPAAVAAAPVPTNPTQPPPPHRVNVLNPGPEDEAFFQHLAQQNPVLHQQIQRLNVPVQVRRQMMLQHVAMAQRHAPGAMGVPGVRPPGVPSPIQQQGAQTPVANQLHTQAGTHPNQTGPSPQPQLAATATPLTGVQQPHGQRHTFAYGVNSQGQQIQIRHQQTFGLPGAPPFANLNPSLQQQNLPPPQGPSALERARENMAEMRRLIDEMRNAGATNAESEQRAARLASLQEAVNNYIDPMQVGGIPAPTRTTQPGATGNTANAVPVPSFPRFPTPPAFPTFPGALRMPPALFPPTMPMFPRTQPPSQVAGSAAPVTCYLLSSPQGPQAIVLSPEHGTYSSESSLMNNSNPTQSGLPRIPAYNAPERYHHGHRFQHQPNPNPADAQHPNEQLQLHPAGQAQQPPQNAPAAAEAAAANQGLNVLLGHFWLLMRVLIFAYFLLGANMGWRRPIALALIGFGFWMIRVGLFAEGGLARRWWEDVIRAGGAPANAAQAADGAAQAQPDGQPTANADNDRPGRMPTPEELAHRLLNERQAAQDARFRRLRELIRPVERAVALFVASLWPGIGEAHVRERREAEERQRREEQEREVAEARRREEAETEKQARENEAAANKTVQGQPSSVSAEEAGQSAPVATGREKAEASVVGGTTQGDGPASQ